jgi:abnormal spindle-like microcephaly-associated protein
MYYDERWMEKQENGFKKWLNFVLTPPEDFETTAHPGQMDVGKLWAACTKDVKVPRAPTREVLSIRAYAAIRELNSLRRNACLLWQSPAVAKVVTRIETEVCMCREDHKVVRLFANKKTFLIIAEI